MFSSSYSFSSSLFRWLLHRSSTFDLLLPQNPSLLSLRLFTSMASARQPDPSTVSYLVEKCGLSQGDARSAAKSLSFSSPGRPDSVVEFLRDHGFSQAHISHIIQKLPKVLSFRPEKTLLPKLDFLRSKGFTGAELRRVILGSPWILARSLEGHIVPSFDFISNLIRSNKKTLSAIKRYPSLLVLDTEAVIVPKMNLFREYGVPEQNFGLFIFGQPRHVKTPTDRFKEIVERVKGMGISPSKVRFVIAVQVLGQLSQSTWDRKLEIYSRGGWSEEMTLRAFVKYPWCMLVSQSKITAVMDYYIKEMGLESSFLSEYPLLTALSLKKRIMPRCSVIKALSSKGLIGRFSLRVALCMSEEKFLEKYVTRFPLESNHLLSLYGKKMGSKGNGGGAPSEL